jgi:hypothetical protein
MIVLSTIFNKKSVFLSKKLIFNSDPRKQQISYQGAQVIKEILTNKKNVLLLLVTIQEGIMLSNTEKQRKFKEKMYKAGFKQTIIWVKRKEVKYVVKMKNREFMKRLEKLISGWDSGDISDLYNLFIKIATAKREAIRLKKKEQI